MRSGLEPNAAYETAFRFYAGHAGSNVVPKFEVPEIDGIYRIVWTDVLSANRDDLSRSEALLAAPQRVSNRFLLKATRK